MSRDEIIQMAEDCGIAHRYYEIPVSKKGVVTIESCTDRLLKFAELVAERHEWIGLTDEEIQSERHKLDRTAGWTYDHFARAIETKLKQKNVPQP